MNMDNNDNNNDDDGNTTTTTTTTTTTNRIKKEIPLNKSRDLKIQLKDSN